MQHLRWLIFAALELSLILLVPSWSVRMRVSCVGHWWHALKRLFALTGSLAVIGSCGEGFSPSPDTVSGPYTATIFSITQNAQTVDLLAGGASLTLTLLNQGTTEGRLFVPEADEDGTDLDLSLAGSWSLDGNRVTLQHEADSFLRDLTLTASASRLDGEFVEGDQVVRVRLEKPQSND